MEGICALAWLFLCPKADTPCLWTSCNFHTQLLGFVFLNFLLNGAFPPPPYHCLRVETESQVSPRFTLQGPWGGQRRNAQRSLLFISDVQSEIHNLSWKVCVHSQVIVTSFKTVKRWALLMLHKMTKHLLLKHFRLLLCSCLFSRRMYAGRHETQSRTVGCSCHRSKNCLIEKAFFSF